MTQWAIDTRGFQVTPPKNSKQKAPYNGDIVFTAAVIVLYNPANAKICSRFLKKNTIYK